MQGRSLSSRSSKFPWIPYAERRQREINSLRARVLYKERGHASQNYLGNVQKLSILLI